MVKGRKASAFMRGAVEDMAEGPSIIAAKAMKQDEEIVKMAPHKVIRHAELQQFWGAALKEDEVHWDKFWTHFPDELPPEAALHTNFGSLVERTAFQKAIHVVGSPDYITVSMVDATFPPGCSIQQTTAKLLKKGFSIIRNCGVSVHQSTEPQRLGFWDQKPSSLPSLVSLAAEVEAELMSSQGQRPSVALVQGHSGSGAMSVALEASNKLLASGSWAEAVYVGIKGARSAEAAAARLASGLGILSFPVITNELLRLTTFLHARSKQQGRLGIVLDSEGCKRADELHGLSVLVTTLVKAGQASVQIIVAGEGSLELSLSIQRSNFFVQPSTRDEELKLLTMKSPRDYLEDAAPAIAAACSRQPALLELVGANLLMGTLTPHPFLQSVGDRLLRSSESKTQKGNNHVALVVTKILLESLKPTEQEALIKLSVLPSSYTLEAATVVLGVATKAEAAELLAILRTKDIIRQNTAGSVYGLHPLMEQAIQDAAQGPGAKLRNAAIAAFVEYALHIADDAAALNASSAQVAAMWAIDRERPIFDELVNLLDAKTPLPAVTHSTYAEIVAKHMDLLGFRLSEHQQQELCAACAQAAKEMHDVLGEARALQHLGPGSMEAAEEAMALAMGTVERALTPNHPVIADILLSRARLQSRTGNHAKAERLLKRCLEIQQRHRADGNTLHIAATKSQLGGVCIAQANPISAEAYLQASLGDIKASLGDSHPDTGLARCRLASCRADMGRHQEAYDLYIEALDNWRSSLGHCHPHFAVLLGQLAFCCSQLKKPEAEERYYRRSIQMWKDMYVLDQQELQQDLQALSSLLTKAGRHSDAAALQEQAICLAEAVKAAQARISRRPLGKSKRLQKMLLKPLKMLCISPATTEHAIALPMGMQDTDLAELRQASHIAPETRKSSRTETVMSSRTDNKPPTIEEAEVQEPTTTDPAPAAQIVEVVFEEEPEAPPAPTDQPDTSVELLTHRSTYEETDSQREMAKEPVMLQDSEEAMSQQGVKEDAVSKPVMDEEPVKLARRASDVTLGEKRATAVPAIPHSEPKKASKDQAAQSEMLISINRRPPFVSGPFKERVKVPSVKLVPVADSKAPGGNKHARSLSKKSESSTYEGKSRQSSAMEGVQLDDLNEAKTSFHSKSLAPLDINCNTPVAGGDLIRAHTGPHQLEADSDASGFTTSPDSTHGAEEPGMHKGRHWAEAGIAESNVTGYVNPMFSNQSAKELPNFEENPVFEL